MIHTLNADVNAFKREPIPREFTQSCCHLCIIYPRIDVGSRGSPPYVEWASKYLAYEAYEGTRCL